MQQEVVVQQLDHGCQAYPDSRDGASEGSHTAEETKY